MIWHNICNEISLIVHGFFQLGQLLKKHSKQNPIQRHAWKVYNKKMMGILLSNSHPAVMISLNVHFLSKSVNILKEFLKPQWKSEITAKLFFVNITITQTL